jgi:hypothetical protein
MSDATALTISELLHEITQYWRDREHKIETRIEYVPGKNGRNISVIRSNMSNGLPIGCKPPNANARTMKR